MQPRSSHALRLAQVITLALMLVVAVAGHYVQNQASVPVPASSVRP